MKSNMMRQPVGTTEISWPADIEHGVDVSKSDAPTDGRAIIFLLLISVCQGKY